MLKLDTKDKKILYELSKNARLSYAELGKKTALHKDTVAYRMKQLETQNIISGYTLVFNFGKLDVQIHKLYIKFGNIDQKKIEQIAEELKKQKHIIWIVLCNGTWDMIATVTVQSNRDFYSFKQWFEKEYEPYLYEFKSTAHVEAYFYSRDYLVQKPVSQEIKIFETESKKAQIDSTDIKIIELLANNSRIPTIEIAKALKITAHTIAYRIRQLEKAHILLQCRASINIEEIGYIFVKAFIKLQSISQEVRKKILEYCRNHPNIIHNVECLGEWDLEPEFEVQSIEVFYQIISEMRHKFAQHIASVESVIIHRELKYKLIPLIKSTDG